MGFVELDSKEVIRRGCWLLSARALTHTHPLIPGYRGESATVQISSSTVPNPIPPAKGTNAPARGVPFNSTIPVFPHSPQTITNGLILSTARHPWSIPAANRKICPGLAVHSFDPYFPPLDSSGNSLELLILCRCCLHVFCSQRTRLSMVRSLLDDSPPRAPRRFRCLVSRAPDCNSRGDLFSAHSAVADDPRFRSETAIAF